MLLFYQLMFGLSLLMMIAFRVSMSAARKNGRSREVTLLRWVTIGMGLMALSYFFRMHDAPRTGHVSLNGFLCGAAGAMAFGRAWAENVRLRLERLREQERPGAAPPPAASRFSLGVHQVMLCAGQEAWRHGDPLVDAEHLLLGILRERPGGAMRVLDRCGVSPTRLEALLSDQIGPVIRDSPAPCGGLADALTERGEQVRTYASQEAHRFGSSCVGTEHLLLGLLLRGDSVAAHVLFQEGIHVDRVRQYLLADCAPAGGTETGRTLRK